MRLGFLLGSLIVSLAYAASGHAAMIDLGGSLEPSYGAWSYASNRTLPRTTGGRGYVSATMTGATDPDPTWGIEASMTTSVAMAGRYTLVEGFNPYGRAEEFAVYKITSNSLPIGTPVEIEVNLSTRASGNTGGVFDGSLWAYIARCPQAGGWCTPDYGSAYLYDPLTGTGSGSVGHLTSVPQGGSISFNDNLLLKYTARNPFDGSVNILDFTVGDQFTLYSVADFSGVGNALAETRYTVNSRVPGARITPVADILTPVPLPASIWLFGSGLLVFLLSGLRHG